ncbi:MAG TPA: hypothetical protein VJA25_07550 [Dehalococcoidia bacterium]|nr:hypothetical protein [Dehalococcoidia bacterium]
MRWIVAVATAFLLLLPQFGWGQTPRARVGAQTVGNLEIALYIWGPQELIHPKGTGHPEPPTPATHHLDVRVYDLRRAIYIPYRDRDTRCEACGAPVAPGAMLQRIAGMLGAEDASTLSFISRYCVSCRGSVIGSRAPSPG